MTSAATRATALDLAQLSPGFADPTRESQAVFRATMNATARPGSIADLSFAPAPPHGLNRAAGAFALTLVDQDTPLWLDPALRGSPAETWLRFHCACPLVEDPMQAAFAMIADPSTMPPLAAFYQGDAKYPDRAATIIVIVPSLVGGPALELRGPGIAHTTAFAPAGLPASFWADRAELVAHFQYGIDLAICADTLLVSIPRTTRIAATNIILEQGA